MVASVQPLSLLSAHSLLNIESLIALSFLLAVLARSRSSSGSTPLDESPVQSSYIYLALMAVVGIAYCRVLGAPFVFDDYTHITDAHNATWSSIASAFGPVERPPGLFYRPFGFLVYWLNYLIAGPDPRLWHAASLLFHALNACLLYSLSRSLRFNWAASLGAALLFALSGSATEAVAWVDARFDPMATGLVLGSLLCVCRFLDGGRLAWIAAACITGAAAFASKESAFCLPLLVACLWFFRPSDRKRLSIALAVIASLTVIVFAYRWWALGGIGGYRSAGGESNIASFSLVRMLNAVFIRDWTILFFPVNWSGSPGWLLSALLLSAPVMLGVIAWKTRPPRRAISGSLAMTILAALPVQHLLLIGVDLSNTRYVYLPSVGWALLWGSIFSALPQPRWKALAIGWMLALHLLIAQHNLQFWLRVPEDARQVCIDFGHTISSTQGTAIVGGLPLKRDGVVFLSNGFPECVGMNSGVPASRVTVYGTPNFIWNPVAGRIEPVPGR